MKMCCSRSTVAAFAIGLVGQVAGCGDDDGCTKDTDCKGSRVCAAEGRCVDAATSTSTASTGVGASGTGGSGDPASTSASSTSASTSDSSSSGEPSSSSSGGAAGSGGSGATGGRDASGGGGGGDGGTGGAGGSGGGIVMAASYQTEPGYFDAVLDIERNQLFLSYGGDGEVRVVDLASGGIDVVTTGYHAEFMHFDPILDHVVISLPTQAHSSYWWDEDQEGYVAAIDAVTLADPAPIWIPLDPWRIVSDGTGNVYAAGGSGQWTSAVSVDLGTGVWTLSSGFIRQNTNIHIHPDLDRVYGADTDSSPSDIERWDISNGVITPAYDSPYHGDYPMCGELRIHPDGNTIYTPCGHVFLASNVQLNDMTWVGDLGLDWIDLAFHPAGAVAYLLVDGAPAIYEYDTASLSAVTNHTIGSPADRLLTGPDYLVLVRSLLGGNPKTEVQVIPYSSL